MAVIQISKIQVRRGLQTNLPQLASAEFGWSVDERRLYIGNGTLAEGAPTVGNTEILTEYTDVASVVDTYFFKGTESGYTSQTGASSTTPVTRTLQAKLDEQISVRDFGAVGDGLTDDTTAVQRALNQVFPTAEYANKAVRRVLHFPAGTYKITSTLAVPTYAIIRGDGIDSTVIQQVTATKNVLTFADSDDNVHPDITNGSADAPTGITVEMMTLDNTVDADTVLADSISDLTFNQVKFKGSQTSPTTSGTGKALLHITSVDEATSKISAVGCVFTNGSYGVLAAGDVQGVSVVDAKFDTLYQGVNLSEASSSSPKAVRVTNSTFDNIANSGIVSANDSNVTSAFNYFKDVGDGLSAATPSAVIVSFANPLNYTIGDLFDRTETEAETFRRVTSTGSAAADLFAISVAGPLQTQPGGTDTISGSSTQANTSLIFSTVNSSNMTIDYNIVRGTNVRTGTLRVSINSSGTNQLNYEDDFVEYPTAAQGDYGLSSPTGTLLEFRAFGSSTMALVASTSAGTDVTFKYQIRQFI